MRYSSGGRKLVRATAHAARGVLRALEGRLAAAGRADEEGDAERGEEHLPFEKKKCEGCDLLANSFASERQNSKYIF